MENENPFALRPLLTYSLLSSDKDLKISTKLAKRH